MNLFDYINWRGDLEFIKSPFNPVDNIIFSQLSYLPMDGIVPGPESKKSITIAETAKLYEEKQQSCSEKSDDITVIDAEAVIKAIGTSPRFKALKLFGYESKIDISMEKQFAAYCTIIRHKRFGRVMLVVFRGTDMRLIGWKEDFNMCYKDSVPSQKEAISYLEKMAGRFSGPIFTIGHSKGGNLAIYAAACCRIKIRQRIAAIYSNDAPGFHSEFVKSAGYRAVCSGIKAFIPQSSIIGMLFEHGETPMIVKSTASGAMQHNLCSWEVTYNNLAAAGELTRYSLLVDSIIRDWMNKIDDGQRQQLIETIYKILISTNANTVSDLTADWLGKAPVILNAIKTIDAPTKKLMRQIFGSFIRVAGSNIRKAQKSVINYKFLQGKEPLPGTH